MKSTPLALFTVTSKKQGRGFAEGGGRWWGLRMSCRCLAKRLGAGRRWTWTSTLGWTRFCPSSTLTQNGKYSMQKALVRDTTKMHSHIQQPYTRALAKWERRERATWYWISNEALQHQRVRMKRRRKPPDLRAGQRSLAVTTNVWFFLALCWHGKFMFEIYDWLTTYAIFSSPSSPLTPPSLALIGPCSRGCHSPANRLSGACSLSNPKEGVSQRATPWLLLANSGHLVRPPASEGKGQTRAARHSRGGGTGGVREWGRKRRSVVRGGGVRLAMLKQH